MKEEDYMGIPNEKGDERVGSREPFHSDPTKNKHYAAIAVGVIAVVAALLYVGAHVH